MNLRKRQVWRRRRNGYSSDPPDGLWEAFYRRTHSSFRQTAFLRELREREIGR